MLNDSFLTQEEIDALLDKKEQPEDCPTIENEPFLSLDNSDEEYRNLDLILDFPLTLSVCLGEVKKSIKEVCKISSGTVVELDHFINDPVEVFVGGKLIARGEVVVIQEHFGIKITHIIDPVDRIRKLR
ncbi:MAG TPA: flagellar motor switch protein FliN [Firmicutes bacterium]|nr:flagellar motor switch protein FliN [Bacillota bacterium]